MKVLLVSPNKETLPDPVFPLGLAYVASAVVRAGHEVRVVDLAFSEDVRGELARAVTELGPEVVGISLRNIDDVSFPRAHSYLAQYKEVVLHLRALTDAPIVLGGSGFTILPREFMRELGADHGIEGEGEEAFPKLLTELGRAKGLRPVSRLESLDSVTPAVGLFDTERYYRRGGMLNLQTKRGCSFQCTYCTYPSVEGTCVRLRSPERVVDEIEGLLDRTGVRHLVVVDSVFNNPADHAEAVCREIARRRVDLRWSATCTPLDMSERLVELMLRAGCTGVELGVDSLYDEGLRTLGKSFTLAEVREVSKICRRAGLKFCHFVFIGAPGDTLRSARESLETMDELAPDAAVFMVGIRVFPRTELARRIGAEQAGLEPLFSTSPEVLDGLDDLSSEVWKRRNWVMPGLRIRISSALQRRLRDSGVKGPLWETLSPSAKH